MALQIMPIVIALVVAFGAAFAARFVPRFVLDIAELLFGLFLFGLYLALFKETTISGFLTSIAAMKYVVGAVVGIQIGKLVSRFTGFKA